MYICTKKTHDQTALSVSNLMSFRACIKNYNRENIILRYIENLPLKTDQNLFTLLYNHLKFFHRSICYMIISVILISISNYDGVEH